MIATYSLLASAVLLLWAQPGAGPAWGRLRVRVPAWFLVFAVSLAAAWWGGIVQPAGVLGIAAFGAAVYAFAHAGRRRWVRGVSAGAIVVLGAGLLSHALPGFANPRVLDRVRLRADAIPFSLHLNYDKTVLGLFILGWCHARLATFAEWREMLARTVPRAVALIALVTFLALAGGYVRFDPRVPAGTVLWLGVNLGFTCVAEEAFFRGFVQAQLQRAWSGRATTPAPDARANAGAVAAQVVAAALFGLAHFAGGPGYVALATVAGWGYGEVYRRTQRIEASILTHFALNTVHFLGFTYPALAHR